MRELLRCSLNIITAIIFGCSITYADFGGQYKTLSYFGLTQGALDNNRYNEKGRLDFEWHTNEWLTGHDADGVPIDIDFDINEEEGVTYCLLTFSDGCSVEWVSDLQGRHIKPMRWLNKRNHGVGV